MKRLVAAILSLVLALSLCGCGASDNTERITPPYKEASRPPQTTTTAAESINPELFEVIYEQHGEYGECGLYLVRFVPNDTLYILTSTGDICPILDTAGYGCASSYDSGDLASWYRYYGR